jgi:hypothetical protein
LPQAADGSATLGSGSSEINKIMLEKNYRNKSLMPKNKNKKQ